MTSHPAIGTRPPNARPSVDDILRDSCDLYVRLMKGLLAHRRKPDWTTIELEPTGATQMELNDIEIGRKYRCDYKGAQYFATVVSKDHKGVWVTLADIVNEDGDPGDPSEALGTLGKIQVAAAQLRPL
jgi:hypothetical protein